MRKIKLQCICGFVFYKSIFNQLLLFSSSQNEMCIAVRAKVLYCELETVYA